MTLESSSSHQGESDVYSYQGKSLEREEYLGPEGNGPLGDQFIPCPKCGKTIHKFAIRCHDCSVVIREIGKIESGPRGSSAKGIGLVVGILVFALAAMVLAERAYSGGRGLGVAIPLSIVGFVMGINGLLGSLYFRYFVGFTFIRGLLGFGLGVLSLIVGIICFVLLI
ncbi:MAG: hypothetical protein RBU30_05465 [Polyangia bacterium]|jgi:hypothetical protein|nr:hypothetical protein [Polyangia bacterium]